MPTSFTCPRCGDPARPPGLWSDTWTCATHGSIAPCHPPVSASHEALLQTAARATVPLWLPWPLPANWFVTGVQVAGDDHTGPVATVLACSGPHPLPERHADPHVAEPLTADLLVVAEQPGVGLAARLAGLPGVDPGAAVATGAPHLKVPADGHDVPLWAVGVDGAAAYVGEAAGVWLWCLVWPAGAAAVLLEQFELLDLSDGLHDHLDVPFGALSPRLSAPPA